MGGIVAHYISRVEDFNLRSLTGVVAIFGGAGVIAVFNALGGIPKVTAVWWYPVGCYLVLW